MTLVALHGILENAFSLFTVIISAWALVHLIKKRELEGNFWGAVVVGEILVIGQAIIGGVLMLQGHVPGRQVMHMLYGAVILLAWPATFAFTKGGTTRRDTLAWVLVSIFLFGIAMRASVTGMP